MRSGPPPLPAAAPKRAGSRGRAATCLKWAMTAAASRSTTSARATRWSCSRTPSARRLVTNAEYQAFVDDGGYRRPSLWLSDGWAAAQALGWSGPLHWRDGGSEFTPARPAAACCRSAGAASQLLRSRCLSRNGLAPVCRPSSSGRRLPWRRMHRRNAWARSGNGHAPPTIPTRGFKPWAGAVGEYNGKFMVGQIVLRGSSSATPAGHARPSYRNFFPPATRWQYSGLRLARDL